VTAFDLGRWVYAEIKYGATGLLGTPLCNEGAARAYETYSTIRAVVDGMNGEEFRPHRHHTRGGQVPDPELACPTARAPAHRLHRRAVAQNRGHNVTSNICCRPFDTDGCARTSSSTPRRAARATRSWRKARAEANPSGRFGTIESSAMPGLSVQAQAGYIRPESADGRRRLSGTF